MGNVRDGSSHPTHFATGMSIVRKDDIEHIFWALRSGRLPEDVDIVANGSWVSESAKAGPGADRLLALHAAVDAEALWDAGVALLRTSMPAYHYLMALPTEGMKPFMLRTSLPVPDEADYWERLNRVAPLEGLLKRLAGRKVSRMSDMVPFVVMRFSPFYRKFMKPEGWRYSAAMFFWDGDRYLGQFSQNRTAEQGDFTDRELEILEALHPHFEVAIRRVMLFDHERATRSAVEQSIRRSPLPTVVLDWELRSIYHNAAAVEASAAWRLDEQARSHKLAFVLPEDVRDACEALREGIGWTGRERNFQERERILNHSSQAGAQVRLRVISPEDSRMSKPRILAEFWNHPGDHGAADQALLLARLTPTERKVALCVGTGLDNDAIAGELGISRHTVRSHLRNIFEKLSVTNRTQLALKVRSSAEGRV